MPDGSIYVVGRTKSDTTSVVNKFHTTADALQAAHYADGDSTDGYIAKFNKDGDTLKSLTFIGGNGDDVIMDINLYHSNPSANNNAESIAIVGLTGSNNWSCLLSPKLLSCNANVVSDSLNAHGNLYGGVYDPQDAFFAVITGTGTTQKVSFSTYIGGTNLEDETNSYGPTIALGLIGAEYIGFSTKSKNVKSACQVNTQVGSYNSPGDSSTHDVYLGKIYPFVEHYIYCPTCNPCKLDENENTYESKIEFYPVPFEYEVSLRVNALNDSESMIMIYNAMGEEILRQRISVVQGINDTKLYLKDQPSGIYLCRLSIDGKIETAKIIKH